MKRLIFVLSAGLAISFAITVSAQEFSADMVSTNKSGSYNARIYVNKDRTRTETPDSIVISRMDKKLVWMLIPAQKIYMEQPFDPEKMMMTSEKMEGEIERTLLGKDVIGGKPVDKYKVTYELNGIKNSMYQWIDSSLNLPVKTEACDGTWTIEYRNIKTGPQPGPLFELPGDYSKFDMPDAGNLMKGMRSDKD